MDIQTVLIFILGLLTLNMIAVGIYVILVLRDFRETVKKANNVLGDVNQITSVITNPITTIAGIVAGVTQSVKAVKSISGLVDKKKGKK